MNVEEQLKDNVMTLNLINYQVADLLKIKGELEARVAALLESGDDGSQTYLVDKYKVTISKGLIFFLLGLILFVNEFYMT